MSDPTPESGYITLVLSATEYADLRMILAQVARRHAERLVDPFSDPADNLDAAERVAALLVACKMRDPTGMHTSWGIEPSGLTGDTQ